MACVGSDEELRAAVLCQCFAAENLDNAAALCAALETQNYLRSLWEKPEVLQALCANPAAARAVFKPPSTWQKGWLATTADALVQWLKWEAVYAPSNPDAARIVAVLGRLAAEHAGAPRADASYLLNIAWCGLGLAAAMLPAGDGTRHAETAAVAFACAGADGRRDFWGSQRFAAMVAGPSGCIAVKIALEHDLKWALDASAPVLALVLRAALESGRDETFAALEAAGVDVAAGLAAHAPALKTFAACMSRSGYSLEKRLQARLVGAGVLAVCCRL